MDECAHDYASLRTRYDDRRQTFLTRVGKAQGIQEQVMRLTGEVNGKKADEATYEMVAALFQSYAEAEHDELRTRIETLVTYGLQCVFGEGLAFRLVPGVERGQATIAFQVVSEIDGEEIATDVLEARGGGLASVIGFILRVVVLTLGPKSQRKFLMLDETFGMVSAEYQEPLSRLLRLLVDQTGLQVVLVTHAPKVGLEADLVYRLEHDGTKTVASVLATADL